MLQRYASGRGTVIAVVLALVAAACGQPIESASSPPTPSPTTVAASPSPPSPEVTPTATSEPPPSDRVALPTGGAWSKIAPGGRVPRAREDHTWTVDGAGTTAYLFGGRDGSTILGDLFAYDLRADTWRRLTPAGPGPAARFGHEAIWVDDVGLVVFAGQAGPTTFFGDLWAFDPGAARWTRLPARGAAPVPRYGTCSAAGDDGRLWISHGFTEDGTRFADTRAYDFGTGSWSDETPAGQGPVVRCLHGCFVDDGGRFILYAGQTTGVEALGDLWALAGPGTASAAWTRVEGALPAERNLYAFARLDSAWVIVGGRGAGPRYLADIHLVDAASLAISPLPVTGRQPGGRAGATLVADADRLLLFGGKNADGPLGDLWRLDLEGATG